MAPKGGAHRGGHTMPKSTIPGSSDNDSRASIADEGGQRIYPASQMTTQMSSRQPSGSEHTRVQSQSGHSSSISSRGVPQLDGPGSTGSDGGRGRSGSVNNQGRSPSRERSSAGVRRAMTEAAVQINKNLDLGPEAYALQKLYEAPKINMMRPGYTTGGRDISVQINSYRVKSIPQKNVFQYDVHIGNGDEKRGLNMAVFDSKQTKQQIGDGWIYDGNKIAWANSAYGQKTFHVDMDREKGRTPNPARPNSFRITVRQTKELKMNCIFGYLQNQTGFSNECLEAINFLDHLLRETPSREMFAIKRSFFEKGMKDYANLGAWVVAVKGVYQSMRPAHGGRLVINADVANQCFWMEGSLLAAVLALAQPTQEHQVIGNMQKPKDGFETAMFRNVQRIKKVRFTVDYPKMPERIKGKVFVVDQVLRTNCRETKFDFTDRDSGRDERISVLDYFLKQYGYRINSPNTPVIQAVGKMKPKYPAEVCHIVKGQKYPFKLSDVQTAAMIKFAVTRPAQRSAAIQGGLNNLNWDKDPMLKKYGLTIEPKMLETKARLLNPPSVEFRGAKAEKPGTSGRWRVDGKQFLQPNKEQLNTWGVMVFNDWSRLPRDKVSKDEVIRFMRDFMTAFKTYGGQIGNNMPAGGIQEGNADIPNSVKMMWDAVKGGSGGHEPQLLIFIVNAKSAAHYNRVKRQCDCRFGVPSQVMQAAHIKKNSPQYIGNVLLKVFAKLGGFGFKATPATAKLGAGYNWFTAPTVIVGADVSHGAAGSRMPSLASMTVSMDKIGCRYWAQVQSNGIRKEIISTWNLFDMLAPMFREWLSTVAGGKFPSHMIYFRDGVSEGQYQHVLQQEVRDMKAVWKALDQSPGQTLWENVKFTVVIASKRHHIRFFPKAGGDRNGNPNPGTIVERDVTHPREYDFYLCSHSAIQGTARPVHYHVLMDEAKMPVDKFVNLVYNHSYQYARSTTPISIFPAVYYAHLAAKRAVAHDRNNGQDQDEHNYTSSDQRRLNELQEVRAVCDRTGKIMTPSARDELKALERMDVPTLLPLGPPAKDGEGRSIANPGRFKFSMWYI